MRQSKLENEINLLKQEIDNLKKRLKALEGIKINNIHLHDSCYYPNWWVHSSLPQPGEQPPIQL